MVILWVSLERASSLYNSNNEGLFWSVLICANLLVTFQLPYE